jgi:hypothetical protein
MAELLKLSRLLKGTYDNNDLDAEVAYENREWMEKFNAMFFVTWHGKIFKHPSKTLVPLEHDNPEGIPKVPAEPKKTTKKVSKKAPKKAKKFTNKQNRTELRLLAAQGKLEQSRASKDQQEETASGPENEAAVTAHVEVETEEQVSPVTLAGAMGALEEPDEPMNDALTAEALVDETPIEVTNGTLMEEASVEQELLEEAPMEEMSEERLEIERSSTDEGYESDVRMRGEDTIDGDHDLANNATGSRKRTASPTPEPVPEKRQRRVKTAQEEKSDFLAELELLAGRLRRREAARDMIMMHHNHWRQHVRPCVPGFKRNTVRVNLDRVAADGVEIERRGASRAGVGPPAIAV